MPFLSCTEEPGYIACITEVVSKYMDVFASDISMASLDIAAVVKPVNWDHKYSRLDY